MIEFTHATTRYTVLPENVQALRALAAKPRKIKRKVDRNHDAMRRDFPVFCAGMSTDDYLSQYAGLNSRLLLTPWAFDNADRVAPMLDPSTPEVSEELDPDWTPPAFKAKKLTPAQLLNMNRVTEEQLRSIVDRLYAFIDSINSTREA